jgi:hypothetical protein
VLGRSKYGVPLSLIPLGKDFKNNTIQKMIDKDWNIKKEEDIYSCMHVTMLLKNK